MQTLQNRSGSGAVTIPKHELERDDLVDEDGEPKDVHLVVERLGERCYCVRICDGSVPDLEESDVIRRIAAEQVLEQDDE